MGAKLFAWLGGLALFLCVAFFVKYSFDHNLIPPEVRVAIGFVAGIGLVAAGVALTAQRYRVTALTLVATGVVSLYAVTFACDSIYHFAFFGPLPTFGLMAMITAAAFILAVRTGGQVIVILGMLGGFLTPILIQTGHDNPPGLFTYLGLLVAGTSAVALHRRWIYLVPLSAGCTLLLYLVWADHYYAREQAGTAMIVGLAFSALYAAVAFVGRRTHRRDPWLALTACVVAGLALFLGLVVSSDALLTLGPGPLLAYAFAADALLLALNWVDERIDTAYVVGGGLVFVLLGSWTLHQPSAGLLPWILAGDLLFAAVHTAYPLLLARRRPGARPPLVAQLFAPLGVVLMLIPLVKEVAVPFILWPSILLVDAIAIGAALLTATLTAVAAVLVLTLAAAALAVFQLPVTAVLDPSWLLVVGFFALFFFFAGLWLVRRLGPRLTSSLVAPASLLGGLPGQLSAGSALLPFVLLVMVVTRLDAHDPAPIFVLGLLLDVLVLGLARLLLLDWLPAFGLFGITVVELVWRQRYGHSPSATAALPWNLGFYGLFALYPFAFATAFRRRTGPFAVAALSGLAHFWLVYPTVRAAWPAFTPALVPLGFAALPLAGLAWTVRTTAEEPARTNRTAWFGGVALFFITAVFPVQFDRQWLTVSWALEGAALLWLFRRVRHPGLRGAGCVLLLIVFARLALNGAVFSYHPRAAVPLWNWYLYAYGLAAGATLLGARFLAAADGRIGTVDAPPILRGLGAVLLFYLLNLEIADYFTPPGRSYLTFDFSGNFARDMSYTIGWALFALGLLAVGIWRGQRVARYAGLGLLSCALLKLFFHDLASLEALYRIGALFAVAIIAMLASFAYQRFLPADEKSPPPPA